MEDETAAYVLSFARFVTGFVFLWSAGSKLRDFAAFERAVANFQILPPTWVKPSAMLFVSGELTVVVLMLLGSSTLQTGFGLATFLLLAFSFALITVLTRKLQTPCNCFGSTQKPVSPFDVVRNAGLLGCALAGRFVSPTNSLELAENALLGLMAVTISVVWIKLGDLAEIFL